MNSPTTSTPTWTTWREALGVMAHPAHLKNSLCIAAVVDLVLFAINEFDLVLRGDLRWSLLVKGALNFVVPFCVANLGILTVTRRKPGNTKS